MTQEGVWQKGASSSPVGHPRRAAHEPTSAPPAGSFLAAGGVQPPETILFTVEPITITGQGVTYRTERTTLAATRVPAVQTSSPPEPPEPDQAERSLAAKVFELLTALDPDNRLRKAPPIKVFNLYYRQRLGPAEIARKCDCDRSLIYDRLAAIQEKVPWTPEQLQDVSPHVEAMQEALTESRAKGIYRKGAAYGDDDSQEDD